MMNYHERRLYNKTRFVQLNIVTKYAKNFSNRKSREIIQKYHLPWIVPDIYFDPLHSIFALVYIKTFVRYFITAPSQKAYRELNKTTKNRAAFFLLLPLKIKIKILFGLHINLLNFRKINFYLGSIF